MPGFLPMTTNDDPLAQRRALWFAAARQRRRPRKTYLFR